MKRLRFHLPSSEMACGPNFAASKKQLAALQCSDGEESMKKQRNHALTTHSNFKVLSVFLISVFGIIFLVQNFSSTDQCVSRLKDIVNQHKGVDTVESIKLNMASLSRVINAIVLQNAFQEKSITMQKVMADTLDVQQPYLINTITKTTVDNFMNTIKAIALLPTQLMDTIKETANNLNKLDIDNGSESSISQVLFSFNASSFHFGELQCEPYEMSSDFKLIFEEVQSSLATKDKLIHKWRNFYIHSVRYESKLNRLPFFHTVNTIVNSRESIKSFILDIEKYQLLTNQTYLRSLIKNLDSLQLSATVIENLSNCEQNKLAKETFDAIDKILSNNGKKSDQQGLKYSGNLMEDFDNVFLKQVLNNGKSLDYLKILLRPVLNFKTQMKVMENVLSKSSLFSYFKLVRQICASKPKPFTSLFANVKAALENIRPIGNLNNAVLSELKQFLHSSMHITSFIKEREIVSNISKSLKIKSMQYSLDNSFDIEPEKVVAGFRREFLSNKYEPEIHLLGAKIRYLENYRKKVINLFSKTTGFSTVLTNIRKVIPHNIKLDIQNIGNYVQVLNSLLQFSKINNLSTQNKYDKWVELKVKLEKEIEKTEGLHRLKNFPFAYETTYQLQCSQRALVLIQRRNLCRIAQSFVTIGLVLSNKTKHLPLLERHFFDSVRKNLSVFEKSFSVFQSEIESLTSKFTNEDQSLKTFGESVSVLNHINFSTFNVSLMISTLKQIKSSLVAQPHEVSDFEKTQEQLEELQFVVQCRTNLLPRLFAQTDIFFQGFFKKHSDTETDWTTLLLVVTSLVIVLNIALFLLFIWIRTIRVGKGDNQNKVQTLESRQEQTTYRNGF